MNPTETRLTVPTPGKLIDMDFSALAAKPFEIGAALRHRRFFHPNGVLSAGSIERLAPPGRGLPVESGPVIGRMSKAAGTPGSLPDAAGLAWRMPPNPFAATPWDMLLVTAGFGHGDGVANRMLLRPVRSWSTAAYSGLVPLRHRDSLWWVRATMRPPDEEFTGLSLREVARRIDDGGLEFTVEQACGGSQFEPLALLRLTELLHGGEDMAFDPVRHTAPGVEVWPKWLRDVRRSAYRSSRAGRRAENPRHNE